MVIVSLHDKTKLDTTVFDQVCHRFATGLYFLMVLRFPPPIKLIATI